ncbi:MAG TPA: ABC transporter ATP-binding protein [Acidobacteriota bacterium]|nr:ABC transporter ATP-binding protein [Acidobacteriota bacterium]
MCSDPSRPVIELRRLSKKYPIYERPSHKLFELLSLRRRRYHREFWALRDIDLEVTGGTTLGVIGQNGSGKSTLLQLIAGILRQTEGDCRVRGRVAALLELGAGFNPEFTGRENVLMNGAIMGIPHGEMEARYPEIVEFAEVGEFIERPVKTYSSGMFMRLAFAVAIHLDPDILLVDEALAVGDLIFQHRCIHRIRRLRREGKTILFVTHDIQALTQFCDRAILLDAGRKLEDGDPEEVVRKYRSLVFERERRKAGEGEFLVQADQNDALPVIRGIPHVHHRFGAGGAQIVGIILLSDAGEVINQAAAGQRLRLLISARASRNLESPIVGFTVRDRMGVEITASNTSYESLHLPALQGDDLVTVAFDFEAPPIRPGSYSISPAIAHGNIWEHEIEDWIDNAYVFDVLDSGLVYGSMKWPMTVGFRRTRDEQ